MFKNSRRLHTKSLILIVVSFQIVSLSQFAAVKRKNYSQTSQKRTSQEADTSQQRTQFESPGKNRLFFNKKNSEKRTPLEVDADTFPKVSNKEKPLKSGHILQKSALKKVKFNRIQRKSDQNSKRNRLQSKVNIFTFNQQNKHFFVGFIIENVQNERKLSKFECIL